MQKLEKLIQKQGLTEAEAIEVLRQRARPEIKRQTVAHEWNPKRVKLGIISDTHIGSKFFNYQAWADAVKTFTREGVDAVYHCGDVIEGMSNRDGHIYELSHVGTSEQIAHAQELLSQIKQPLYFTTGNHDEWAKKKGNQGVLVGPEIARGLERAVHLGEYTADIRLHPRVKLRLTHCGQSAYALSYPGQKQLNALSGGDKPDIQCNGHLHKYFVMRYRNVNYMEAGTFQNQTPFMADKGSPAMVAYTVLDIAMDKRGVVEFTPKMYTYY